MFEFIFGGIIGIWAAQQFNLPSVQKAIINWWSPSPTTQQNLEENKEDDNVVPFTGEIATNIPTV
jgi:hypothetical protein